MCISNIIDRLVESTDKARDVRVPGMRITKLTVNSLAKTRTTLFIDSFASKPTTILFRGT